MNLKPDISILLPSLREQATLRFINALEVTNKDVNYEIVLVSPFRIDNDKVKWIEEKEKIGSVKATYEAYLRASSDNILYCSDDIFFTNNSLNTMIKFVSAHKEPFIGAFKMTRPNGNEIGPFGAYGKFYACYGCLNRKTIELIGGFFDISFKYSWVDIDLSLRCWEANGIVKICQDAIVIPNQIEDDVYKQHRNTFKDDFATFIAKWHNKLGKDMPIHDGTINRRL